MRDKKKQISRIGEYYPLLFDLQVDRAIFSIKEKYITNDYDEESITMRVFWHNVDKDFITLQSYSNNNRERFDLYVGDDPEKICGIIQDDFKYTNEFYIQLCKYNIIVDTDYSSTDLTSIYRNYTLNDIISNE